MSEPAIINNPAQIIEWLKYLNTVDADNTEVAIVLTWYEVQ